MSRISPHKEALFADALVLPPAERGAFLAKECGADVDLLAHLVALVAAHEGPESLTSPDFSLKGLPAGGVTKAEEKPGDAIGRYKLLQKIGEGGCGVVWMAEQEEPVRRRVALKVIKLGMDTKAVVARFEAERQALAMMDHANIAKVQDAGSTETGRPFFVMELVRGIPITKYCDENHLTPNHRLELFIRVCHAIQHAHQKGVIHRDIKPSNILVTVNDGAPTPKVIDFGIAKATQGRLTDATVFTAFEQFIGTPAYMSPEQAEMSSLDIDTRSDIYSLGVLLYELLTGRPPFDPKAFAEAGVDQIRQQIREVEPPRPSARLRTLDDEERTTIARLRNTAVSELSIVLRGDLDWIVMRCIEKDRTRRYDSANGLAADIQRYLRNEPVVARPPSTAYLLRKLIRRHRLAFAAAIAIFGVMFVGGLVSTGQAIRARRAEHEQLRLRIEADAARELAAAGRRESENLIGFLLEEFYEELAPTGRLDTIAKLAEQAVIYYDRLPAALRTPPTRRNRAMALMQQGSALMLQDDVARWKPIIERSIAEFEALRAAGDTSEESTIGLALALGAQGWGRYLRIWSRSGAVELNRAVELLRPIASAPGSSRRARRAFADILDYWSHQHAATGGLAACEEARRILQELGALTLSNLGTSAAYADTTDTAASIALGIGRLDDAETFAEESLALAEKILLARPGHLRALKVSALARHRIATIEARRFQPGRALVAARKCAVAFDNYLLFEPMHLASWRFRIIARIQIVQALLAQGRVTEAAEQFREAIALGDEAPPRAAGRWPLAILWREFAAMAARRGDRITAENALAKAARVQATLGNDLDEGEVRRLQEHVEQSRRLLLLVFGEHADAFRTGREALARFEAAPKDSGVAALHHDDLDEFRRAALVDTAQAALRLERFADAERAARSAADGQEMAGVFGSLESLPAYAQTLLAIAIARQGRLDEARDTLAPAIQVFRGLQKNGAEGVEFTCGLALSLYACAIATDNSPEDSALLDEAARLLNGLSDEAKLLQDVHRLIRLVAAELGKEA